MVLATLLCFSSQASSFQVRYTENVMSAEEIEKLNLSVDLVSNVLRGKDGSMRGMVLNYLLMISGREDHQQLLQGSLVNDLMDVAEKCNSETGRLALEILINVSGTDKGARHIIESNKANGDRILRIALDSDSLLSDDACKLLTNLTRLHDVASEVASTVLTPAERISSLLDAVSNKAYNRQGNKLEYMAHVVGNLCQSREFRQRLLDSNDSHLSRILPVITTSPSSIERYGVASAVYNCLFDTTTHETLMGPPYDILPVLLLPLAGPEEFDAEDYDKMPLELQYLPDDKTREESPSVRNVLLRSLLHLCATRKVRSEVRDRNTYFILREYHKWEKDRQNLLAAENVIDILIRTEDEIGVDDLSGLEVSDELKEKFENMDKDFITDE